MKSQFIIVVILLHVCDIGFVLAVWKCRRGNKVLGVSGDTIDSDTSTNTSTHTNTGASTDGQLEPYTDNPGTWSGNDDVPCKVKKTESNNEGDRANWPTDGYYCNPRDNVTILLGISFNRGERNVERSLAKTKYGVEVLKEHTLDYEKLKQAIIWKFDQIGSVLEANAMTLQVRKVSTENNKATYVYQTSSVCGYVSNGEMQEDVVRAYSEPLIQTIPRPYSYSEGCKAWLDWYTWLEYAKEGHENERKVRNVGNKPLSVCFAALEGVKPIFGPQNVEPYNSEGRGDDTDELMAGVLGNLTGLPSPSPTSGVDWPTSMFKLKVFEKHRKDYTFNIPTKRELRVYQANAGCGGNVFVYGPLVPVYFTLPTPSPDFEAKECESPFISTLCVKPELSIDLVTPEAALDLDYEKKCRDEMRKVQIVRSAQPHVELLNVGIKGPHADKVGDDFKNKFLRKVNEIGTSDRTEYDWTTFEVTSWHGHETPKKTIPVQMPSDIWANDTVLALQLLAKCGPYTMYTDEIAFVLKDREKQKECIRVFGLSLPCDKMPRNPSK